MRDHLSKSKVMETELAKPLFDALLRVALGNHSADFEHDDAMTEKVWITYSCVVIVWVWLAEAEVCGFRVWHRDVVRTYGPGFGEVSSMGSVCILWDGLYLHLIRQRRAVWHAFLHLIWKFTENCFREDGKYCLMSHI